MKNRKTVVHIILNSHLDPVWLWKLEQGIDEVIATARTACDLLDDYPEIHLTRGEAWFYETVEKNDPGTFRRLKKHIADGRLHVVGGWYVQPDCNLASPETYRKHGEIAGAYFREKFGVQVKTGYNVDAFGHSGFLPDFYNEAGISNYVMMRPMPKEMELPGEVFRWRSPNGSEVLTARIHECYNSHPECIADQMATIAQTVDPAIGHVMFFCGLGDHGAGPTRNEIDYILAHRYDQEDVEFRFSHPDAFFEEVRRLNVELPVVTGELQYHAIGCYTVTAEIKRSLRSAENKLIQAEKFLTPKAALDCWKKVLFASFHDVLAGSSIRSSYPRMYDLLGAVRTCCADAVSLKIRQKNVRTFKPDEMQRIVFDNTGKEDFKGIVEFEPWLKWICAWRRNPFTIIRLFDEKGRQLPYQPLPQEAAVLPMAHFAVPMEIPAGKRKVIRFDYEGDRNAKQSAEPNKNVKNNGFESLECNGFEFFSQSVRVDVIRDETDTWSHSAPGAYPVEAERSFRRKGKLQKHFAGPIAAQMLGNFHDGKGNTLQAAFRREAGLNGIRIFLRLRWNGDSSLLKLVLKPSFKVCQRIDGATGGEIERPLNGREYPFFNHTRLIGEQHTLAVVSKDCFGVDVQPDGSLRLTLLRTPYYAHHDPNKVPEVNFYPVTGQGEQEYEIVVLCDSDAASVRQEVFNQTQPVVFSETTIGVNRWPVDKYADINKPQKMAVTNVD